MAGIYATADDVRDEILLFDAATVPDAELTRWIAQAGMVIDAFLGARYQMPAPLPLVGATQILQVATINYAAARALRKHMNDRRFGDTNPWDPYMREFQAILKQILDGDLFGGVLARPTARPMSVAERYVEDTTTPRLDSLLARLDYETAFEDLYPSQKKILDELDAEFAETFWGPKV